MATASPLLDLAAQLRTSWSPLLPVLLAVVATLFVYQQVQRTSSKLPPGPPRAFFGLGNTPIPDGRVCSIFEEWGNEFGEIFTVWVGWRPLVVVGRYEAAMVMLEKESSKTADRPWSVMAGDTLSGGKRILLVKYSERWRRLRKLLHQGLQPKMATSFESIQERAARVFIEDIIDEPDGFQAHAKVYAASVIMSITYGKTTPTRYTDPDVQKVNICGARLGGALRPGAYLVDNFPILRFFPGQWKTDGDRWHQEELELFSRQLDGVRSAMKGAAAGQECFGRYIISHQEEYGLSNDEAAYLAGSMFGAGSDTTASALAVGMMACALYPAVVAAAQAEIDQVVGRERPPTFSDQADLIYLQAFVKEVSSLSQQPPLYLSDLSINLLFNQVFRWRPVSAGGFTHQTTEALRYKNFVLPGGTQIIGNHWGISRDATVFEDPDEFRPERWLEGGKIAGGLRKDVNHVGYGFGRRICAGKNVADRSVYINCALLLWSFEFSKKLDSNGKHIEIDTFAFTNTANSHPLPFQMSFKPRPGVKEIFEELATV